MIEHNIHFTNKGTESKINNIDSLVLKNWMQQTDLIPVVNAAKRGAYDVQHNELHGLIFEGYSSNLAIDGEVVR